MSLPPRLPVLLVLLCSSAAFAPAVAQKTVNVNLARASFQDAIPFREDFTIQGAIPKAADKVVIHYRLTRDTGASFRSASWSRTVAGYDSADKFAVNIPGLIPDREYTFCVLVYGDTLKAAPLAPALPAGFTPVHPPVCTSVNSISDPLLGAPKFTAEIKGTPASSWKNHFDQDLGVMHSSEAAYTGLVTSVHLQMLPYNKNVDLLDHGRSVLTQLGTRVSVFAGLSPVELSSDTEQPVKKTPLGVPVVGVGFRGIFYWGNYGGFYSRFVQPIRLNAGVMFFEQDDPNPLVDKTYGKTDAFVSLTAEIELKEVLGPIAGLFGLK